MMDRTVPMADRKAVGGGDGSGEIGLGFAHGVNRGSALGQQRRNGGRERAARAMRIEGGNTWRTQFDLGGAVVENVDALGAVEMPAFQ